MKFNSTVAFTLILLVLMVGAGLLSATWGMSLGRQALKGITQPDTRPNNNGANRQGSASRQTNITFFKEDDIISRAKTRIDGSSKSQSAPPEAKPTPSPTPRSTSSTDPNNVRLPMVSQSQDVALELKAVRRQGESLVMQVSLRNTGKQPVRFLYSFLNVTDDRGRAVSASTEGLPAELPASSETFSGTISIPMALVEGVEKVSLTLTDYPDQRLQLQLSNIPVVK